MNFLRVIEAAYRFCDEFEGCKNLALSKAGQQVLNAVRRKSAYRFSACYCAVYLSVLSLGNVMSASRAVHVIFSSQFLT